MQAQGQTEQSEQPLVPLTSPPPVLQEPVEEQQPPQGQQPPQEQLLVEGCPICLQDVQTTEPREQCRTCSKIYHKKCIIIWLYRRRNERNTTNCPNCRTDMSWFFEILPSLPQCPICHQYIGPKVARIPCFACDSVYHQDELLACVIQLNNEEKSLVCFICSEDISWVIELQAAPASPDDLDIQPTELNIDIYNFNLDSESDTDAE